MSKFKIVAFSAPPISGKSALVLPLSRNLNSGGDRPWIVLDNELGFSQAMRVLCAESSGLVLNSPEFARKFNLRGQLDYQASARFYASQGFNIVLPGPFENLVSEVSGRPLYQHMKEVDFKDFDFSVVQMLLWPDDSVDLNSQTVLGHPAMVSVEAEVQRRRIARGSGNETQQKLDHDKQHATYYSERARLVLQTNEAFPEIQLVKIPIKQSPEKVAERVATAILNS